MSPARSESGSRAAASYNESIYDSDVDPPEEVTGVEEEDQDGGEEDDTRDYTRESYPEGDGNDVGPE